MPVIIDDDAAFVDGGVVGCRVKSGEDVVLVRDDGAHQLDDVRLVLDLVAVGRHRQQRRTETDRQVVRVHHVLVAELRQTAAQHDAIARNNKFQTNPFNGPCPGLPGTRKVQPIWILLKQQTVSGSGISWALCMSVPHSR